MVFCLLSTLAVALLCSKRAVSTPAATQLLAGAAAAWRCCSLAGERNPTRRGDCPAPTDLCVMLGAGRALLCSARAGKGPGRRAKHLSG